MNKQTYTPLNKNKQSHLAKEDIPKNTLPLAWLG